MDELSIVLSKGTWKRKKKKGKGKSYTLFDGNTGERNP